ncbi:MAG: TRAP transporter small permease subunit [Cellvibrionaceae bacterium]
MTDSLPRATTNHSRFALLIERYLIRPVDNVTEQLGRAVAWLTILMALMTFILVFVRYVLKLNSIALQESVVYMHCLVFLLGIGFTLKANEHVRVDIFYRNFSEQKKAWIDCIGSIIFLLPICAFLFFISFGFVAGSWQNLEGSSEAGGIPAVFLLKTLIPLTAITAGLQGISLTLRNILFLIYPHQFTSANSINHKIDEPAL